MSGKHAADATHPVPSVWSKPRQVGPVKHSTATHVHEFKIVAEFEGLRESIAQCACGETKTVFRVEADS